MVCGLFVLLCRRLLEGMNPVIAYQGEAPAGKGIYWREGYGGELKTFARFLGGDIAISKRGRPNPGATWCTRSRRQPGACLGTRSTATQSWPRSSWGETPIHRGSPRLAGRCCMRCYLDILLMAEDTGRLRGVSKTGPWHNLDAMGFATLAWVDWLNNRRLL